MDRGSVYNQCEFCVEIFFFELEVCIDFVRDKQYSLKVPNQGSGGFIDLTLAISKHIPYIFDCRKLIR